jgi:hypothetical protein
LIKSVLLENIQARCGGSIRWGSIPKKKFNRQGVLMKVNTTQVQDDFYFICEVCDHMIKENPVHYVEMDSEGIQTRWGSRQRHYVHQRCVEKLTRDEDFV